jgi:hypothetical protein
MEGVLQFKAGDPVLIYRTSDYKGPAKYRSVITSICVVEETTNMNAFASIDEFIAYCEPYSIFTEDELKSFYKTRKYPFIIKMSYNVAFTKRVTNGFLVDNLGIRPNYWGVFEVSDEEFKEIIKAGQVNESLIID